MTAPGNAPADDNAGTAFYPGLPGLTRAPFENSVQDAFFYAEPTLIQRLDLLQHLTQFSDLLLAVCGPAGVGKSMLAHRIAQQAGDSWRVAAINAVHIKNDTQLFIHIAEALELHGSAADMDIKRRLLNQAKALRQDGRYAVVLVDNAEQLAPEQLETLLHIGGELEETLRWLRIILLGKPELCETLQARFPESTHEHAQLHFVQLMPFSEVQTASYLSFRLAVAGYSGESPFSAIEVRAIHLRSEGLPARINEFAHARLLERGNAPSDAATIQQRVLGGRGKQALIIATGLALMVVAWKGWEQFLTFLLAPDKPPSIVELPLPGIVEAPAPKANTVEPGADNGSSDATATVDAESVEPEPVTKPDATPAITAEQEKPAAAPVAETVIAQKTESAEPAEKKPAAMPAITVEQEKPAAAPVAEAGIAQKAETNVPAEEKPAATPVASPPPVTPAESAAAAVLPPQTAPPVAPPRAAVVDAETKVAATATTAPAEPTPPAKVAAQSSDGAHREEWLLARDPEHYTLQLLGVAHEKELLEFVRTHDLTAEVAYYYKERDGNPWYALLYGDYANVKAARAALEKLPKNLRARKPWPRSFASIQSEIRATAAAR